MITALDQRFNQARKILRTPGPPATKIGNLTHLLPQMVLTVDAARTIRSFAIQAIDFGG